MGVSCLTSSLAETKLLTAYFRRSLIFFQLSQIEFITTSTIKFIANLLAEKSLFLLHWSARARNFNAFDLVSA